MAGKVDKRGRVEERRTPQATRNSAKHQIQNRGLVSAQGPHLVLGGETAAVGQGGGGGEVDVAIIRQGLREEICM